MGTTTRFHKAARDGLMEILKEATRKECNCRDEDGMTPTLWAAYEGRLDALRSLVGKGGNPEKANFHFGQNALHLSASRGHASCVAFLVAFDVNVWALDHEFHTAMELAAINDRRDIVDYLDKVSTSLELANKKRSDCRKGKARKEAEKRFNKREERLKKAMKSSTGKNGEERVNEIVADMSRFAILPTANQKKMRGSSGQSFTQIVGVGSTAKRPYASVGVKKVIDKRMKNRTSKEAPARKPEFSDSNSFRSLKNSDKELGSRINLWDLFLSKSGSLSRSKSQSDISGASTPLKLYPPAPRTIPSIESGSLFERPGFGSVAFRQNFPVALSIPNISVNSEEWQQEEICSIGSAGSLANRITSQANPWDTNSGSPHTSDDENSVESRKLPLPLQQFLVAVGLSEYENKFIKQRIDMETLFILTDQDLMSLGLPLGPRKKLLHAVKEYKSKSDLCKDIFC